jgi:two-component system, LytTR family, response regulator
MKAILIDDESSNREVLRNILLMSCPDVQILGEAANARTAYELICNLAPDVIFLDVQMPVENGFDLLRKFETVPCEIIFVTAFNEYAIDAIRFSALDYLVKPVEISLLKAAVEKARSRIKSGSNIHPHIVNLLHNTQSEQKEKKIAVHVTDRVVFVPVNEIICAVGEGNYTTLFTAEHEKFLSSKTIREYEDFFSGTKSFVRISKSALVNVSHIKTYSKGDPCIVTMQNGQSFEMSRRKKQEALEMINVLLLNKKQKG